MSGLSAQSSPASTTADRLSEATPGWASAQRQPLGVPMVCLAMSLASWLGLSRSDASRASGLAAAFELLTFGVIRRERRQFGKAGLVSPISPFFAFWPVFIFVAGLGEFGRPVHDRHS